MNSGKFLNLFTIPPSWSIKIIVFLLNDFITENEIPFCLANVVKYICRKKGNRSKQIEDLRKAIHYLELHLEKVYKVDPQGEDLPFED